ncbi:hypothetical protein ACR42D_00810 [Desulfovibrio caledoniensis]
MRKTLFLLCAVAALLTGCGDNGPLPTLMGRHDYTFTLPADWQDTHNDVVQVLFNSVMSDRTVTEHMLFHRDEGGAATILIIASDRGGPYTQADRKRHLAGYLRRPVKKAPLKVVSFLDDGKGTMAVESYHRDAVFFMRRVYTKKGYIQSDVMCPLNAPETIAEARAIMDSLAPAPDLTL